MEPALICVWLHALRYQKPHELDSGILNFTDWQAACHDDLKKKLPLNELVVSLNHLYVCLKFYFSYILYLYYIYF